ncbi:hypothetical protein LCGC14_1838940 [marine sediment metagenome]|uniref:Uncharacterized protein n=1 Tax=marine sediment metagenome TaxID=412755 RepID=A0A0F9GDV9_9ZZZZ
MESNFEQLLSEGAHIILKKQGGENVIGMKVKVAGESYHGGMYFGTPERLFSKWDSYMKAFLSALKRKQLN